MDRAYEGNETRQLALALAYIPVVPPLSTRVHPWTYDCEMYKRRNVPSQLYLPVGVNQFCRFTSLAWPRCWAALVR